MVIEPDGRLVGEELSMAAPGVQGPAAEFLHVGRLEATIDWPALFGGSVVVKRLKLTDPIATLSQNRATGRLNVAGLALVSGKQSAGAPVLPEIESDGAEIVIGEHDDGSITIKRDSTTPYKARLERVDLTKVAAKTRHLPEDHINEAGNHMTEAFVEWLTPLVDEQPHFEQI